MKRTPENSVDLYTYYRSTSSYRVRIALALKGLDYRSLPINLLQDGGEQLRSPYRALNPQGRVPTLRTDDGALLVQSPAILEYLEEVYPQVPLLAGDAPSRARQRAVAAIIGCDIHPLHNVAVLKRLRGLDVEEPEVNAWIAHWISEGLSAVESLIGDQGWCFGELGLADIYLLPQLYAARRYAVQLGAWPRITRVEALGMAHPAFIAAHPDQQADKPG